MASSARESVVQDGVADLLFAHARHEGSASHPYPAGRLGKGSHAARDLSDAVHYIVALHGRNPGVVDLAARAAIPPALTAWVEQAVAGFERERAYLTRLVVAAGPLPSTPGQAESETAVLAQSHALEMLASSDRAGCALGAAMGLVLDWQAIRLALNTAARRFSVEQPQSLLPSAAETGAAATLMIEDSRTERALLFGARQILVQQRGMWELLESRQIARGDH